MFNKQYLALCAIRLFASLVCAFVLGLECKKWQHTVGLRILILISVSCTLLCMLSTSIAQSTGMGDAARIAAGVVTGIGFLGGGAIMRQGLNIRGLTSASVIWVAASLGLSCGASLFAPAAIVLAISFVTLVASEYAEGHYSSEKTKVISIKYTTGGTLLSDAVSATSISSTKAALESLAYIVRDVNIEADESGSVTVKYFVKSPPAEDPVALVRTIEKTGSVSHLSIGDEM